MKKVLGTLGLLSRDIDKERAVKIAEDWITYFVGTKREKLTSDVFNLFNTWKNQHGMQHLGFGFGSSGALSGLLAGNLSEPLTEEGRLERIRNLEAWECTSPYIGQNPLDLLKHLWVSDYKGLNKDDFLDMLELLIVFCASENRFEWIEPITKCALWLADIRISILKRLAKAHESLAVREFNRKKMLSLANKTKKTRGNFGRLLRFKNTLKNFKKWAKPMELLKADGSEMRGILLSMGVEIDPYGKNLLTSYLSSQHPKKKCAALCKLVGAMAHLCCPIK